MRAPCPVCGLLVRPTQWGRVPHHGPRGEAKKRPHRCGWKCDGTSLPFPAPVHVCRWVSTGPRTAAGSLLVQCVVCEVVGFHLAA